MSNRKMRVMVVDDAALVRLFYRQTLEKAGFTVDEALNGLEALEKVLSQAPDLLIVDVNMPQMDGITFIRTLRRQERPVTGIPVLITSTEAAPHDVAAAREAGANFYLVKPIDPDRLSAFAAMMCGVAA
jgi:two-component system chemotaxis response regulator CheY